LLIRQKTNEIQGWLGHRSITSTGGYTALAPGHFMDFWLQWGAGPQA
jgi:hypothetical protein